MPHGVGPERFAIVVLGSGGGGNLLAWHFAQSGYPTAVVERQGIGSLRPDIAWMASKNEVLSASAAQLARHAEQYGTVSGPAIVDRLAVRRRMREMVDRQIAKTLQKYKTSGAELIVGNGRFVEPKTIEVKLEDGTKRVLAADKLFVNVGTHAAIPEVAGLAAAHPLTRVEALELDYVPQHLIVIGGDHSGIELAQAYRRFGSDVTVIASAHQLMCQEDADISQEVQHILSEEDVQVIVGAEPLQVHGQSGGAVTVVVCTPSTKRTINGSDILVAAGSVPNTFELGLEEVGVELDNEGYIIVNDRLQTRLPEVWAIGACASGIHFADTSEEDFRIVRDNLAGRNRTAHDRLVAYCVFTDPPLARVGLSEGEAKRQGIIARVVRLPVDTVPRAQATDQRDGFMKALIGGCDDRILGFAMIGAEAGEVMAAVHTAMLGGLSYSSLAEAPFAHPTMAEGLHLLFSHVPLRATQETKPKIVWSAS